MDYKKYFFKINDVVYNGAKQMLKNASNENKLKDIAFESFKKITAILTQGLTEDNEDCIFENFFYDICDILRETIEEVGKHEEWENMDHFRLGAYNRIVALMDETIKKINGKDTKGE